MKIEKYKAFYMSVAELAAQQSVAKRAKVGCVIVTDSGMMATSWNGTYEGCYTNECEYIKPANEWVDFDQTITKPEVIHAEANSLHKLLSEGVSSKGSTVFITLSPCINCSLLMIGAKVSRVIYKDEYRCKEGLDLLRRAGIIVEQFKEN